MNPTDSTKLAEAGINEPVTLENGVTIQAVEDSEYLCCDRCYFESINESDGCEDIPCLEKARKDRKNARFEEVKL